MINKTFELHKRIKRLSNEKRGNWGEWMSDDHEEQGRGRREEESVRKHNIKRFNKQ